MVLFVIGTVPVAKITKSEPKAVLFPMSNTPAAAMVSVAAGPPVSVIVTVPVAEPSMNERYLYEEMGQLIAVSSPTTSHDGPAVISDNAPRTSGVAFVERTLHKDAPETVPLIVATFTWRC